MATMNGHFDWRGYYYQNVFIISNQININGAPIQIKILMNHQVSNV